MVFNADRKLSVNIDVIKRKFYTAHNYLPGNIYSLNEIIRINVQDSMLVKLV